MRKRRETKFSVLFTLLSLVTGSEFQEPKSIQRPELDFSRLGDIYIGGSFSGVSAFSYEGQSKLLEEPQTNLDDLLIQYNSNTYSTQGFANGRIKTSCTLADNQTVIVAGNFTSLFNQSVNNNIAAVNFGNKSVTPLGNSQNFVNGSSIKTLWCNNSQVYAGGSFEFNGATGVAVWHQQNNTWTLPAFGGFVENSEINSIVSYNDNIVFGGNFSGLALTSQSNSSLYKNTSGLLTPGMQPVSFNKANATGYASKDAEGVDASDVLCPFSNNAGWTAETDSITGYVNVTLAYMSQPTKIRLFNLADGSGTKEFRIISEPAGSFMNMTYNDENGNLRTCAANCPLPEYENAIRYTDFKFVNVVPTSSLKLELLDFYGSHAGLKGLQLFEAGQFAFADNDFNYPRQCNIAYRGTENDIQPINSATTDLNGANKWLRINDFMSTKITDKSKFSSTYAQMNPNFDSYAVNKGLYEVLLYTPGCELYGTCKQRGMVNVTVYPGFGSPVSTSLYQTNEDLKYDLVYNGTLQKGAYIRITPTAQNNVPMDLVAYKVSLNYLGTPEKYNASNLFEYSEKNFTSSRDNTPVGKTAINSLGTSLGSNASVNALQFNGSSTLLVGGSGFSSKVSNNPTNLLSLTIGKQQSVVGISGIDENESVLQICNLNGTSIALGSSEAYNLTSNATSLGIGAYENITPFSYKDQNYWLFTPSEESNTSISLSNGVSKLNTTEIPIKGHLSGTFDVGNVTVYTGSLQIADSFTPCAAVLSERGNTPESPAFTIKQKQSVELTKRATESSSSLISGSILNGAYINSTHAILVGHFNATISDNSTAQNALVVGKNTSSTFFNDSSRLDNGASTIYTALSINESTVVLGGKIQGSIDGKQVQGLLTYSKKSGHPQPLNSNSNDVTVLSTAVKPNTTEIVVGGDFSSASGVSNGSCNGICLYEIGAQKWFTPANLEFNTGSIIRDIIFETGDKFVMAGLFSTGSSNGNKQVATYDFANNELAYLPEVTTSNSPVSSLVILSNNTKSSKYIAGGKHFIKWYDGSQWEDLPNNPLQSESKVEALSLVKLINNTVSIPTNTNSSIPFTQNQALLVSGSLVTSNGSVSVILFDGTNWTPMYGTTNNANNEGTVKTVFSQYGGDLKGGIMYIQGTQQSHSRAEESSVMPTGHVVGIACGIAICCVLVLMLLYFLAELLVNGINRGTAYQNLSQKPTTDRMSGTKVVK